MFKRTKSTRIISLITAMFMLMCLFAACSEGNDGGSGDSDTPLEAERNPIRIGVLVPLSGTNAQFGNDMLNAYTLAVDEINAAGGVLGRQLELFPGDDGADPGMAVQAAELIISRNVDFVVGGYASGATIPTLQQFYDADLMMLISASNSTRITELGLPHFMINSPGSHAVITLADLCKYLGVTSAALIHQGCSYSQDLSDLSAAELPKHGIEIATVEVMAAGTPDVSAIVTSINNSGADFVYWCGYPADGSNVIRQLRSGGYEGYIAVGDGSASTELIDFSGEAGEGVFVTSPPFVEFAVGGEEFVANYIAKFGDEPGTYDTLCYDTIYLLKAAIEKAGTTQTAAVRDAVQGIEYKGLSGTIRFTPEREPELSNFIVLKIENGRFALVEV
ncbi:MAG: branched-chain amino acid ABC transporter substrate-binding protein [Oscillospiraceae bacterium]|nr:branched-chain amino acid ABC transporter substrate-binding protein [Oscillospiraceae bacterium]